MITDSSRDAGQQQDEIDRQLECTLAFYATRLDQIEQRLSELQNEWSLQQAVEFHAGMLTAAGGLFTVLFGRKWGLLSLVAGGLLVQYSIEGKCPGLSLLERMGFRSQRDIDNERVALKVLAGEFREVEHDGDPLVKARHAYDAARRQPSPQAPAI